MPRPDPLTAAREYLDCTEDELGCRARLTARIASLTVRYNRLLTTWRAGRETGELDSLHAEIQRATVLLARLPAKVTKRGPAAKGGQP